jgi:hypothetical protein
VTASEFSFLALGLVLGVVTGAALVEFIRARPPAPREVKLTVAHDAIPRRSTTLADDAFVAVGAEPARGGPADRREVSDSVPASGAERRTTVHFTGTSAPIAAAGPTTGGAASMAGAIPVARTPGPPVPGRIMEPVFPLTGTGQDRTDQDRGDPGPMVGIPISSGEDPALRRSGSERPR